MAQSLPSQVVEYIEELESQDSEALVAAFDRNGYYLYATPNHDQVIGFTANDLLSKNLAQIVDQAEHHAAWVLRTISVFYSKPIPFSSRLVAKSGARIRVSGTLRHIAGSKGEMFFVTSTKPAP